MSGEDGSTPIPNAGDWTSSPEKLAAWQRDHALNHADWYRDERLQRKTGDGSRWILLIKELRVRHGDSILEAEGRALEDPVMRRWALMMMNTNQACRAMAMRHIRNNGDEALIERDGAWFAFREGR